MTFPVIENTPEIIEDSGWSGKEFGQYRGITDYTRTIIFKNQPSTEEIKLIEKYLEKNNCPGWTGVRCMKTNNPNKLMFQTTWDSSD